MVCIIFSDTHGNYNLAAEALIEAGEVDLIFHLGDVASDAAMLEQIFSRPVEKVAGNCDPPGILPCELSTEIGAIRVLLTHGNCYNVKSGLKSLKQRAVATNSQIVLYGHTHNAVVDEIEGIHLRRKRERPRVSPSVDGFRVPRRRQQRRREED